MFSEPQLGSDASLRRFRTQETLERLKACAELDLDRGGAKVWKSILELTDREIMKINELKADLPKKSLQRVADHFRISDRALEAGNIDFGEIAIKHSKTSKLPERYSIGAFGRRRATIASLNYIEKRSGWRARRDVFRRFKLSEAMFASPMETINIGLITDVARYMQRRHQYGAQDLFAMGANLYESDQNSIVAHVLSQYVDPASLYERFFADLMKFFELNCTYTIVEIDDEHCVFDVRSRPDVAEALRVRHLGNHELCFARTGMYACMTKHMGAECAVGRELACVHLGAAACRYEIRYSGMRVPSRLPA